MCGKYICTVLRTHLLYGTAYTQVLLLTVYCTVHGKFQLNSKGQLSTCSIARNGTHTQLLCLFYAPILSNEICVATAHHHRTWRVSSSKPPACGMRCARQRNARDENVHEMHAQLGEFKLRDAPARDSSKFSTAWFFPADSGSGPLWQAVMQLPSSTVATGSKFGAVGSIQPAINSQLPSSVVAAGLKFLVIGSVQPTAARGAHLRPGYYPSLPGTAAAAAPLCDSRS